MLTLSESSAERIKATTDKYAEPKSQKVPGINIRIVNRNGKSVLSHTSGQIARIEDPSETRPLNVDDGFRFYSVGKLFCAIACLQLAERGLLDLDDPTLVDKHLPELSPERMKVFKGWGSGEPGKRKPIWTERQRPVTTRMLLTHSAGVSHTIFDDDHKEMLSALNQRLNEDNPDRHPYQVWRTSLESHYYSSEPGDRFHYSGSMEFLAILIEKLSNMSLYDYYMEYICGPLDMKATRPYKITETIPPPEKLHTPFMRQPDGTFKPILLTQGSTFNGLRADDSFRSFPESDAHAYSISSTVIGTADDFALLLGALLNDGTSPMNGARILKPESVKLMATPQLSRSQVGNGHRIVGDPSPMNCKGDLEAVDPKGNIGISCAVQGVDRVIGAGRGRSAGSFYWYGLANMDWWVDTKAGIAVVAASHFIPWQDPAWVKYIAEVEAAIYDGLEPKARL